MKTCALYGLIIFVASAILTIVVYLAGLHSDPSKLSIANWITGILGLAIGITATVLGVKARRAEIPATEDFGYGRALWAGIQISIVASILISLFNAVYAAFINTGYSEVLVQAQTDKMQAKGMSADQIEGVEKFTRFMVSPAMLAITGVIFGLIFGVILALIIAAFLKRPAAAVPPLAPPPVQPPAQA